MAITTIEITQWLRTILASEDLSDISVNLSGTSDKGDGFTGDIIFLKVLGQTRTNTTKHYNLALKCSKRSEALRKTMPVKELFANEILIYSTILPAFRRFQEKKGVLDLFDCVAKYYGSLVSSNMEVIAFEDLKVQGYGLWDRKIPLTIDHVELVLREYGKLHATGAAMQVQQPEEFKKMVDGLEKGCTNMDLKLREQLFSHMLITTCEIFKDQLSSDIQTKLKNMCSLIKYSTDDILHTTDTFRVLVHADCWNNNFLFKTENNQLKAAIIDWQVSIYGNPVLDLSYFLYSCLSYEAIDDFDRLLKVYYSQFSEHLIALGSDPKMYPFSQLVTDWSTFAKYGVLWSLMAAKAALGEQEDLPDLVELVEDGISLADAFDIKIRDPEAYANKVIFIIKHAAEKGVI